MDKMIFITGVSSGFGKEMANEAARAGNTVVGTVRLKEQLEEVNSILPGKTFGYLLDVNDHEKVNEVIKNVVDKFGKIDVLINNAGYGLMGAVEETSMEEARMQMETNFFGALAVTQAVLPFMRKNKGGHIIQFSSIAGIISAPGLGLYNASKHALEGMSEALSLEVAPLGIKVTLVEPGPFRTKWAGGSMKFTDKSISDYAATAGKLQDTITGYSGEQPGDPVKGAQAVLEIIEAQNPPLRLFLGKVAVERVRAKIKMLKDNLEAWEAVGLKTDYDQN